MPINSSFDSLQAFLILNFSPTTNDESDTSIVNKLYRQAQDIDSQGKVSTKIVEIIANACETLNCYAQIYISIQLITFTHAIHFKKILYV